MSSGRRRPSRDGSASSVRNGGELAAYLRGDERAFERLVEIHGGMVYHTCLRVLREPAAAEDAAQTALLMLARKADSIRGDLAGWLHRVALNAARVALRSERARRGREREVAGMLPREDGARHRVEPPGSSGLRSHIDAAFEKLPAGQRAAVLMSYFENRSRAEVAAILEIPVGTVDSRLHNALRRLRAELSRHGPEVKMSTLTAGLAARQAEAACPAFLLAAAGKICAAASTAGGASTLGGGVAALTEGVARIMFWSKVKFAAAGLFAAALVVVALPVVLRPGVAGERREARAAETPTESRSLPRPAHKVVPSGPEPVVQVAAEGPVSSPVPPPPAPVAAPEPAEAKPVPKPVIREPLPAPTSWPPIGGSTPAPRPQPAPPPRPPAQDPHQALQKLKLTVTPLGHRNADDGWERHCCPNPACQQKIAVLDENVHRCRICGGQTRVGMTAMCPACAWRQKVCCVCRRPYPLGNQFRYTAAGGEPMRFEVELKNPEKETIRLPRGWRIRLLFDNGNGQPARTPVHVAVREPRPPKAPNAVPAEASLRIELETYCRFKNPGGCGPNGIVPLEAGKYTVSARLKARARRGPKDPVLESDPVAFEVVSLCPIKRRTAIDTALKRLTQDRPGWRKEHDWKRYPSAVHAANLTSDRFMKKISDSRMPWARAPKCGYLVTIIVRKQNHRDNDHVKVLVDGDTGKVVYYWRTRYVKRPGRIALQPAQPSPKWPNGYNRIME